MSWSLLHFIFLNIPESLGLSATFYIDMHLADIFLLSGLQRNNDLQNPQKEFGHLSQA